MIYYEYIDGHEQLFHEDLRNGKPIVIIEVSCIDICNLKTDRYKYCKILANSATFNAANRRDMYWLIAYKPDRIFNIEPPKIPATITTVYDVLRNIDDVAEYPHLPDSHYQAISLLPSGYSVENCKPYFYPAISNDVPNYRRLNWYLPSSLINDEIPVHPLYHRPLTTDEQIALFGDNTYQWLQRQIDLYLSNAWDSDYESTYDGSQWVGQSCREIYWIKRFDMRLYAPKAYKTYSEVIAPYRYNIDNNGHLVRSWDLIEQAFHQFQLKRISDVGQTETIL